MITTGSQQDVTYKKNYTSIIGIWHSLDSGNKAKIVVLLLLWFGKGTAKDTETERKT